MAHNWKRDWEEILGEFRVPGYKKEAFEEIILTFSNEEELAEAYMWMVYNRPEYINWISECDIDEDEIQRFKQEQIDEVDDLYSSVFRRVFGSQKIDLGIGSPVEFRSWSRDWSSFSWSDMNEKLSNMPKEVKYGDSVDFSEYIGLKAEELQEYFLWMKQNDPSAYITFVLGTLLKEEMGFEASEIDEMLQAGEADVLLAKLSMLVAGNYRIDEEDDDNRYMVTMMFEPEKKYDNVKSFSNYDEAFAYYEKRITEFMEYDQFELIEQTEDYVVFRDEAPPFNQIFITISELV